MPAAVWLTVAGLLMGPAPAMAQNLLEPRLGGEALLVNCMLYEPTCLKAPATALGSPPAAAGSAASPAQAEIAASPAPVDIAGSQEPMDDPVTTSSTVSIPWRTTLPPAAIAGQGEAAINPGVRGRVGVPAATGSARPRYGAVVRVKG